MSIRALGQQFKATLADKAGAYYEKKMTPLVDYISKNVERDMPEWEAQMARWRGEP